MKYKTLFLVLLIAASVFIFPFSVSIRSYDHQNFTRVVLESSQGFEYKFATSKTTVKIKLDRKVQAKNNIGVLRSELVDRVTHYYEDGRSVFQVEMKPECKIQRNFVLEKPFRVVFDVVKSPAKAEAKTTTVPQEITKTGPQEPDEKPKEDIPPTETERKKEPEAIRTICLDPGHGGTDFGAIGRSNLMEKDITLNIAKRLKKQIESKLGLDVVMTREGDEEVSLNSRVAKANNHKAQIFVSIHVNSSFRKAANGPETYYVSLNATDQEAFQLSQKENSAFEEEIDKLANDDNELKMILWDMAQNEYIKESSKLADFIQFELNVLMHTRNRGVKQAPFRVLMRAAMAAVLVEIAFLSNPSEEKQLKDEAFLDKMTAALYAGIAKYIYNYSSLIR